MITGWPFIKELKQIWSVKHIVSRGNGQFTLYLYNVYKKP